MQIERERDGGRERDGERMGLKFLICTLLKERRGGGRIYSNEKYVWTVLLVLRVNASWYRMTVYFGE